MVIPTLNEARTLEGQPEPPGSVARRCPDLAKLRALTGYEPMVSLEDGLRSTVAWYQARWRQLS
jgi:UDP-glucose 4-epimerase/UDP-glucuronate decarboxylase